jgi:hypothetical protein
MLPSKMAKADFLTGLFLVALGVYVGIESWRMPRMEHLQVHPLSVPGLVPGLLGVVIILFGLVLTGRSARAGGHHLGLTAEAARSVLAKPGNRRLLVTGVLTIGYAGFLIGSLPFWLATALFVFVFVLVFEWRQGLLPAEWAKLILAAAILAAATSAVVTWVFEKVFLVTLP